MQLHRRIRTLRRRRGITGIELARRAGVSPSYVSLIEHGEKVPSEEVAGRIARALGEKEELYRVWAVLARMDERTVRAMLDLQGMRLDVNEHEGEPLAGTLEAGVQAMNDGAATAGATRPALSTRPPDGARLGALTPSFDMLEEEALTHALSVPMLVPGGHGDPSADLDEETEEMLALDARLLGVGEDKRLAALRVDEANGRRVRSWLRPHEVVVLDLAPRRFDVTLMHAFRVSGAGLVLARASVAGETLLLLGDPRDNDAALTLPLELHEELPRAHFGSVIWSARRWGV